jgi:hypothetical protein
MFARETPQHHMATTPAISTPSFPQPKTLLHSSGFAYSTKMTAGISPGFGPHKKTNSAEELDGERISTQISGAWEKGVSIFLPVHDVKMVGSDSLSRYLIDDAVLEGYSPYPYWSFDTGDPIHPRERVSRMASMAFTLSIKTSNSRLSLPITSTTTAPEKAIADFFQINASHPHINYDKKTKTHTLSFPDFNKLPTFKMDQPILSKIIPLAPS